VEYISKNMNLDIDEFVLAVKRDVLFDYLETEDQFIEKLTNGFQFKITIREREILKELVSNIFKDEASRLKFSLIGKIYTYFVNSKTINESIKYDHFPEKDNPDVEFNEHDWEEFCKDFSLVTKFITIYSLPESERIAKNYKRKVTVLSDKHLCSSKIPLIAGNPLETIYSAVA
jgi:hypothetical protein